MCCTEQTGESPRPGFSLSGIRCFFKQYVYMLSLLFLTPNFCTSRPRIHFIREVNKKVENVVSIAGRTQFSFLNEMHEAGLAGRRNLKYLP